MKYKVGDKVRIKSLDWYNKNKDSNGNVVVSSIVSRFSWCEHVRTVFTKDMTKFCGKVVTIETVWTVNYSIVEGTNIDYFTDEMIEGLVEEETKPIDFTIKATDTKGKVEVVIPEGYSYVIENDKLYFIIEKKEVTYPNTYEECCEIIHSDPKFYVDTHLYSGTLEALYKLFICRDAYWKIAGEEMGLGKPWEPSDSDYITGRYCIFVHQGNIICSTPAEDCPFTFPTEEMRDAFYENFKELIESVKELL